MKNIKTKYNKYDLSGNYGVCYDETKENYWIFDLEDYDIIKDYYWSSNQSGYANAKDKKSNTTISMSRLIMGLNTGDKRYIDHINHKVYDNRKLNLRICTNQQNNMNKGLQVNNTSGITGVRWNDKRNKWEAQIMVSRKHIYLGLFSNKEDAIKARKEAEEKYFGEYSYDNSMKEGDVYNVNIS